MENSKYRRLKTSHKGMEPSNGLSSLDQAFAISKNPLQRNSSRRDEAFKLAAEQFADQSRGNKERRATSEDQDAYNKLYMKLTKLREKYAPGLPEFQVPHKNIHYSKISDQEKNAQGCTGSVATDLQRIDVFETGDEMEDRMSLSHEMLHFWAFRNATVREFKQKIDIDDEVETIQAGVKIMSMLKGLNEALTEALNMEITGGKDLDDLCTSLKSYQEQSPVSILFQYETAEDRYSYPRQRTILFQLISKICAGLRPKLDRYIMISDQLTLKSVWNEFAKAYFAGDLSIIQKIIDTIFGAGTFKEIGKLDYTISDNSDLETFMSSLEPLKKEHMDQNALESIEKILQIRWISELS
ncbi:MAG: hypothetical protein NTZ80_00975 [Patescibacteria group bacterium]|nr:hypothetical protein [Patescibacteria group bacterium]